MSTSAFQPVFSRTSWTPGGEPLVTSSRLIRTFVEENPLTDAPDDAQIIIYDKGYARGSLHISVSRSAMEYSSHNWSRLVDKRRDVSNRLRPLPTESLVPTVGLDAIDGGNPWDSLNGMLIVLAVTHAPEPASLGIEGLHPETLVHVAFWARALGVLTLRFREQACVWVNFCLSGKGFEPKSSGEMDDFGLGPALGFDSRDRSEYARHLFTALALQHETLFLTSCKALCMCITLTKGKTERTSSLTLPTGMQELVHPLILPLLKERLKVIDGVFEGIRDIQNKYWAISPEAEGELRTALDARGLGGTLTIKPETITYSLKELQSKLMACDAQGIKHIPMELASKDEMKLGTLVWRVVYKAGMPSMPDHTIHWATEVSMDSDDLLKERTERQRARDSELPKWYPPKKEPEDPSKPSPW